MVVWAVTLHVLSSKARQPMGPEIPHFDKVAHATYFMLGSAAFFLAMRLRVRPPSDRALVWMTLLFAAVAGALDEWHQSFVPGRSGNDVADWTADLLGGVLGLALGKRLYRAVRRRSPRRAMRRWAPKKV